MPEYGYSLSAEEHPPNDLVRHARRAEEVGLSFALISDHFHPWVDEQGHSPFVWAAIGGIATATGRLRLGTGVTPRSGLVERYREAGGNGARYAQLTVCWAETEDEARETAHRVWPNVALGGNLSQELALPTDFEAAARYVTPDDVARLVVCGPDADRWVELVREYEQAGFDHLYFHQVGRDQEGFFRFWERELSPRL